jgi:hypothetical protein
MAPFGTGSLLWSGWRVHSDSDFFMDLGITAAY